MIRAALLALAERCERVSFPQEDGGYKIDCEIAKIVGWSYRYRPESHGWGWTTEKRPNHFNSLPPAYTNSLDAAMTLVPDEHGFFLGDDAQGGFVAELRPGGYASGGEDTFDVHGRAATPALALTAAALRACAATMPETDVTTGADEGKGEG